MLEFLFEIILYVVFQVILSGFAWIGGLIILWIRHLGRKSFRTIIRENDFETIRLQPFNLFLNAFIGLLIACLVGMILMCLWIAIGANLPNMWNRA